MSFKFLNITDNTNFTGTVAGINSLLEHNNPRVTPSHITVVYRVMKNSTEEGLQIKFLKFLMVNVIVINEDIGPWELKTRFMLKLGEGLETGSRLVIFDSDLFFCNDITELLYHPSDVLGGDDGGPTIYASDRKWGAYDIELPSVNPQYQSTSCMFVRITEATLKVLSRADYCTQHAIYNKTGSFGGHGDQGILNAVLHEYNVNHLDEPITRYSIENRLISHHKTSSSDSFSRDDKGIIFNADPELSKKPLYAFHSVSSPKLWTRRFLLESPKRHQVLVEEFIRLLYSKPAKELVSSRCISDSQKGALIGASTKFPPSLPPDSELPSIL